MTCVEDCTTQRDFAGTLGRPQLFVGQFASGDWYSKGVEFGAVKA